jgi:hypothetical protein
MEEEISRDQKADSTPNMYQTLLLSYSEFNFPTILSRSKAYTANLSDNKILG